MSTTRIWTLKKKPSCISIRFQSFRATSRRVRLHISKWVNSEVDLVEAARNPRSVYILPPQLGDNYVVRCCETREYRTSNCVLVFSLWLLLVGSLCLFIGEIQQDNVKFSLIWTLFWIRYSRMSKFKRGICFSLFQLCKKHHFGIDKPEKLAQSPDDSKFLMKTLSQIKSNVAVPTKKKVCLTLIDHPQVDTLLNSPSVLHLIPGASFPVSLSLPLPCFSVVFSTHSSVPLPSRSRRTRRKNASRGGSSMSCTKYSWTRTLSTIVWPMTWQTVCSVKETWRNLTYRCGNRFGEELVCHT